MPFESLPDYQTNIPDSAQRIVDARQLLARGGHIVLGVATSTEGITGANATLHSEAKQSQRAGRLTGQSYLIGPLVHGADTPKPIVLPGLALWELPAGQA